MTVYLLDTTVLVAQERGDPDVGEMLRRLVAAGHDLAVSCVNVAEYEGGLRARRTPKGARWVIRRLRYLETTREGARRAGSYQRDWAGRGRTVHTPDALVAGTARSHGAVVVTDNVDDFPMRDIAVVRPEDVIASLS